jgi:hypothetical protein
LIAVITYLAGEWYALWPSLGVAYLAASYVGILGGTVAVTAIVLAFMSLGGITAPENAEVGQVVTHVIILPLLLAPGLVFAQLVRGEQRSRAKADQLLRDLEAAHAHLKGAAAQGLTAME